MMQRLLIALISASGTLWPQAAPAGRSTPNEWQSFEFLVGTWEAKTEGGSANAAGSGTYVFQLELRNQILARHTTSAGCKGPTDFDCEHADLLYIYRDAPTQPFRAIYFDNEGHVIHYEVAVPAPNTAVFASVPSQPGPQFRLSYERRGSVLKGKFQIRRPGQSEFQSYLEWSGEKK